MSEAINALIANLESAPDILLPLVAAIPLEIITRRPHPQKWSAHEHAVHLTLTNSVFFNRLNLMLSEEYPAIKSYLPDADEETGGLLKIELNPALQNFVSERKMFVEKLKTLAPADFERKANHEEDPQYSVFALLRHLALHDNLHAYRIEEILLKKDWN